MSFTSVVAERAYFRKTSEMTRIKSPIASCKVQNGNECKVLCSFILIFMYDADFLFVSRPFDIPKFEKEHKLFLQCHFFLIYFSQRKL